MNYCIPSEPNFQARGNNLVKFAKTACKTNIVTLTINRNKIRTSKHHNKLDPLSFSEHKGDK
jgi:thiazole synthase ThiGH ThiG subunit